MSGCVLIIYFHNFNRVSQVALQEAQGELARVRKEMTELRLRQETELISMLRDAYAKFDTSIAATQVRNAKLRCLASS